LLKPLISMLVLICVEVFQNILDCQFPANDFSLHLTKPKHQNVSSYLHMWWVLQISTVLQGSLLCYTPNLIYRCLKSSYPDWGIFVFLSLPTNRSRLLPFIRFKFIFSNHPIRRCRTYAIELEALNKVKREGMCVVFDPAGVWDPVHDQQFGVFWAMFVQPPAQWP
jgi:hypothetical protein